MSEIYVLSLKLEKVTKSTTKTYSSANTKEETTREVEELAHVVIKGESLPELLRRGNEHLKLAVPSNATAVDNASNSGLNRPVGL